jgi:hypothetical protein
MREQHIGQIVASVVVRSVDPDGWTYTYSGATAPSDIIEQAESRLDDLVYTLRRTAERDGNYVTAIRTTITVDYNQVSVGQPVSNN